MHEKFDLLNMSTIMVPGFDEKLAASFHVHRPVADALPPQVGKIRALIPGAAGADAGLMDSLPALEIISTIGVGYDRVDVREAVRRGIVVTNTPDVLTDDVADLAIALVIMTSRKLAAADQLVRAGGWTIKDPIFGRTIARKKLGILGLGRIGKAIAIRAESMKLEIAYTSRHKADAPYRFVPNLVELARDSDILIVAASAGTDSHHIVNQEVLEALGPTGLLVNIARGSLVDEAVMTRMLADGKLGGAGLDVFEQEPHVPPALLRMDNVVLTPHLGSGTRETRIAMGALTLGNLNAYFEGRPLPSEVPESKAGRATAVTSHV